MTCTLTAPHVRCTHTPYAHPAHTLARVHTDTPSAMRFAQQRTWQQTAASTTNACRRPARECTTPRPPPPALPGSQAGSQHVCRKEEKSRLGAPGKPPTHCYRILMGTAHRTGDSVYPPQMSVPPLCRRLAVPTWHPSIQCNPVRTVLATAAHVTRFSTAAHVR